MDLFKLMTKARELQGRMTQLDEELRALEATGESGAGAVKARVNGKMSLIGLTIDPSLLKPEEKEILEDLIIAACADARDKVEGQVQEKTQSIMGEMGIPTGFKLPFGG